MALHKWDLVDIDSGDGRVSGIAPVIISASRSTDIPAFYSEWLINRINAGYVKWVNPFNRVPQYVSFKKARAIVFWTKNPAPLIPYLEKLDEKGINYYFTFTLNDYEKEGLEYGVGKLDERIDTFRRLSEKIGKEKVIWRYDPLILTDTIDVNVLLEKVCGIGKQISSYTDKLVISFADITSYRKVQANLQRYKINYKEFTEETMYAAAKGLNEMNKSWGLDIATCSEDVDLSGFNIKKNKCVDDDLLISLFQHDYELMSFLGCNATVGGEIASNKISKLKDKGQRKSCGCIMSKDIGQYNTCSHQCLYCYANSNPSIAAENYKRYLKSDKNSETILY